MATSRTGTQDWKQTRRKALHHAKQQGITHCPICHTTLDYTTGLKPNSATPDHITPWSKGGTNKPENLQIICRQCNSRKGNKTHQRQAPKPVTHKPQTSTNW